MLSPSIPSPSMLSDCKLGKHTRRKSWTEADLMLWTLESHEKLAGWFPAIYRTISSPSASYYVTIELLQCG